MKSRVLLSAAGGAAVLLGLVCFSYQLGRWKAPGSPDHGPSLLEVRTGVQTAFEERLDRLERELASLRAERRAGGSAAAAGSGEGGEDRLEALESTVAALQLRVRGLEEDPAERGFTFVQSENAEMRREGVNILDRIARFDPEARAVLRGLLNDPSPRVREQAAQKLGDLEDKESAPLMAALLADPDSSTRRRAVQALEATDATEYTGDLGRCLVSDGEARVREEAAQALGRLGSPEAVSFLVEALGDSSEAVRGEAITALGELAATSAIPQLRAIYDQNPGRYRLRIVRVLEKLGDKAPLQQEVSRLTQLVASDADERVREQAIRDLSTLARDSAQPVFSRALEDPSPRVRRAAERALR
jgi:HEAT repeat protein